MEFEPQNPYQPPEILQEPSRSRRTPAEPLSAGDILVSFRGRIPRLQYWGYSIGVLFAFYLAVFAIVAFVGEDSDAAGLVVVLLYVPLLWTSLAIQVKRWHDHNKSGWWCLINFLPLIGPIWAFVELGCLRGTYGDNDYGPDVNAQTIEDVAV